MDKTQRQRLIEFEQLVQGKEYEKAIGVGQLLADESTIHTDLSFWEKTCLYTNLGISYHISNHNNLVMDGGKVVDYRSRQCLENAMNLSKEHGFKDHFQKIRSLLGKLPESYIHVSSMVG